MLMRYGNRTFSTMLRRSHPLMNVAKTSEPRMAAEAQKMMKTSAPRKFTRNIWGAPIFEDTHANFAKRVEKGAAQEMANNANIEAVAGNFLKPSVILGVACLGLCPFMYVQMKEKVSPVMYRIDSTAEKPVYVRYQSMNTAGEGAAHGMLKNAVGARGKPVTGFPMKPIKENTLAEGSQPIKKMASANSDFKVGHHMQRVPSLDKRGFYEKTGKNATKEEVSTTNAY